MLESIRFPSAVRRAFLDDHVRLRRSLRELELLAEKVGTSATIAPVLVEAAARFCVELDAHNQAEEAQLEEILRGGDAWGSIRHERMLVEHLEEHRELREALAAPDALSLARAIPRFAEDLRAHIDHEERTFLSAEVLRDDVVSLGPTS
jgi:hypothetical protein